MQRPIAILCLTALTTFSNNKSATVTVTIVSFNVNKLEFSNVDNKNRLAKISSKLALCLPKVSSYVTDKYQWHLLSV